MEILLIHWLITPGKEVDFINHWKNGMSLHNAPGFYREILTEPINKPDPKFNTFSITDKNYSTFINIGIWESVEHFQEAIKQWFPSATESQADGRRKYTITLEDFEFKVRERIVLKHIADRGGDLPSPSLLPAITSNE